MPINPNLDEEFDKLVELYNLSLDTIREYYKRYGTEDVVLRSPLAPDSEDAKWVRPRYVAMLIKDFITQRILIFENTQSLPWSIYLRCNQPPDGSAQSYAFAAAYGVYDQAIEALHTLLSEQYGASGWHRDPKTKEYFANCDSLRDGPVAYIEDSSEN